MIVSDIMYNSTVTNSEMVHLIKYASQDIKGHLNDKFKFMTFPKKVTQMFVSLRS